METATSIRIGVSGCLIGQRVRHGGDDAPDRFVRDSLARYAELRPVCPEVSAGLGVPREAIRLVRDSGGLRVLGSRSATDHTEALETTAARLAEELAGMSLSGFVLKSRSPSCGMERVRVYKDGIPSKVGVGVFARALMKRLPRLPIEEEGRLRDPVLRDSFLDAVFAHASWRQLESRTPTPAELVAFHSDNKYRLMAHSPGHLRQSGRVVARCGSASGSRVASAYGDLFMAGMRSRATRGRHVNVLRHMAGYLRRRASDGARAQVSEAIDDYQAGLAPRSVPIALLAHHAREYDLPYLSRQTYFRPYPKDLVRR